MRGYWEDVEVQALKLLATARKELGRISLKESTQLSLDLNLSEESVLSIGENDE